MRTDTDLRARVALLEGICAEAYQVAGELGAPVRVLDRLWAAAQGEALDLDASMLPLTADECLVVTQLRTQLEQIRAIVAVGPAAAELGRKGGQRTSAAKRRAARANGRRGGRPRKSAEAR